MAILPFVGVLGAGGMLLNHCAGKIIPGPVHHSRAMPHTTTVGLHVLEAPAGVSPANTMDAGATHENHTSRPRVLKNRYFCHVHQQGVFSGGGEEAKRSPD